MKRLLAVTGRIALCATLLGFLAVPCAAAARHQRRGVPRAVAPHWLLSYGEAVREASRSGKPLMIEFNAKWCEPCKLMEATTFRSAVFAREARNWVLLKVDMDANTSFSAARGISLLPSFQFCRSDGTSVGASIAGYRSAARMVALMGKGRKQVASASMAGRLNLSHSG